MTSKQNIPSKNYEIREQLNPETPEKIVDLIVVQLDRIDEAKRRIDEEGCVVRDLRGVVPHPAIQIEINASKLAESLIGKYQRIGAGGSLDILLDVG